MEGRSLLPALSAGGIFVSTYISVFHSSRGERARKARAEIVTALGTILAADERAPVVTWKLERLDARARIVYGLRALMTTFRLVDTYRDLERSRATYERELL